MVRWGKRSRVIEEGEARIDPGFQPPFGNGRNTTYPPTPGRKPLIDMAVTDSRKWHFSDHALRRCNERGIGVFEVLSAIYAPDWTAGGKDHSGTRVVVRGDVQVVYNPTKHEVISVIDRLAEERTYPREPLAPAVVKPASVAAEEIAAETALPESESVMATPTPVPSGPLYEARTTARTVVRDWLLSREPGTEFKVQDVIDLFVGDGYSSSALRQAVNTAMDIDRIIERVSTENGTRGIYRVSNPGAVAPAEPEFVSTEDTEPAKYVGHVRAVVVFENPPTLPSRSEEADYTMSHLRDVVENVLRKNPGQYVRVFDFDVPSKAGTAGKRASYLRKRLDDSTVELVVRGTGETTSAIYARYMG